MIWVLTNIWVLTLQGTKISHLGKRKFSDSKVGWATAWCLESVLGGAVTSTTHRSRFRLGTGGRGMARSELMSLQVTSFCVQVALWRQVLLLPLPLLLLRILWLLPPPLQLPLLTTTYFVLYHLFPVFVNAHWLIYNISSTLVKICLPCFFTPPLLLPNICRLYSSDGNDPGPLRELILRAFGWREDIYLGMEGP